ncbi:MAG: hypothetical protein E6J90_00180 [Deltaproteobacteria bacterium]|nr:MAG: hypothetical protein E6J90_00180 [Deltaproteobacteria bacterium]
MALLACGGGAKPPAAPKPAPTVEVKPPPPPPETEQDREKRRHDDALAIVPDGATCLPVALKNPGAPRLELAAIDRDAVVCAIDQERTRLLGAVACWTVEVSGPNAGVMTYQPATPLPGRGFAVMIDDHCARGFCLPKDVKVPSDSVALMAWNLEGTKIAVLVGDDVHIFDAPTKAHESSFSIRGDKGVTSEPTALHWNGEALFVEASDGATSPVWVFKPSGTAVGPIEALGGKDKAPLSTRNGSFLLLDAKRVAISEQGLSTLTIYETDTGKRSKLVRKVPAPGGACKKDELDARWHDASANISAKCKDFIDRNYTHLIGADAVAGTKNLLVMLRGPRLGELAVIDAKTLAEHKAIKMPWCDAAQGGGPKASAAPAAAPPAPTADKASSFAPAAEKAPDAPARKAKAGPKKPEDPDAGGQ